MLHLLCIVRVRLALLNDTLLLRSGPPSKVAVLHRLGGLPVLVFISRIVVGFALVWFVEFF